MRNTIHPIHPIHPIHSRRRIRWLVGLVLALAVGLLASGSALAAEFAENEIYRLEAGAVIEDDLYVVANEIYIDGTVQGDLVAAANSIEINGTVQGDALVAGSSVLITGDVQDDVRAAGSGVRVTGTVGDDLFAAGGGGGFSMTEMSQKVEPGVHLETTGQVGGDAVLAGGRVMVDGVIADDLFIGAGELEVTGQVAGDAELMGETITVREGAIVAGRLSYASDANATIAEGVATNVEQIATPHDEHEEASNPVTSLLGWLVSTILMLAGFGLLGWLGLRTLPTLLLRPVETITAEPFRAGLTGMVGALLFIFFPVASALLVFVMVLFAGWFPGLVLLIFLFGVLGLFWFLSPLITGIWLGQQLNLGSAMGRETNSPEALLVGVLLLVLLGQIPFIGWFVYLASFVLALGGVYRTIRGGAAPLAEVTPEAA